VTNQVTAINGAGRERSRTLSRDEEWPADFEAFVHRHSGRLVRSLALVTLDRGLAEDAAQDAFLQLYLHWSEVSGMRDPAAWLYRVGLNRCKDYRRALSRAARLAERLGQSVNDGPQGHWSSEANLLAILRPLPKRQRAAAALHYLAGFSTSEIATTMSISEGAVGSHLHKARESLRKVLETE
jgi:RNA polymerase sigma factor (sigma-70 family)